MDFNSHLRLNSGKFEGGGDNLITYQKTIKQEIIYECLMLHGMKALLACM